MPDVFEVKMQSLERFRFLVATVRFLLLEAKLPLFSNRLQPGDRPVPLLFQALWEYLPHRPEILQASGQGRL